MTKFLTILAVLALAGCTGLLGSTKHQPVITELKAISQVSVNVSYKADGVYQVRVDNDQPDKIILEWDSSAYLNTGGETVRLIQMDNAEAFPDDVRMAQTQSFIAPGERFKTFFVGESWMDYARRGVTPRPKTREGKAMLFLAFDIKGKRMYWKGEIAFVSSG